MPHKLETNPMEMYSLEQLERLFKSLLIGIYILVKKYPLTTSLIYISYKDKPHYPNSLASP